MSDRLMNEPQRIASARTLAALREDDEPINMAVKRLHPDAKLPVKAKPGDSGFDVFARTERAITILARDRVTIPTGIAIELPAGWGAQVCPRSGLASKHGVVATLGVIDNGFRGELGVTLYNLDTRTTHTVYPGDKIAQLVVARVPDVRVVEVAELSETERAGNGFGSSGR